MKLLALRLSKISVYFFKTGDTVNRNGRRRPPYWSYNTFFLQTPSARLQSIATLRSIACYLSFSMVPEPSRVFYV